MLFFNVLDHAQISKHFPDLPSLYEMGRNQSLTLINSHFSISYPIPLLPNQVETGGMHLQPSKPLPNVCIAYFQLKKIIPARNVIKPSTT